MMDKCDRQWDGYNWRKYYYCYEMIKNTHWYSCEWGEQKRMENTMGYIESSIKLKKEGITSGSPLTTATSAVLVITALVAAFYTR